MKRTAPTVISAKDLKLKRLETGLRSLDRVTGGLAGGSAYLFYGEESVLQRMFNTLVSRNAAETGVLVVTLRDYHHAKSIDTFSLADAIAALGGDPVSHMKRILVANAYSRRQALALGRLLAEEPPKAGLVAVLHLTDLYKPSRYSELLKLMGLLKSLLAHGSALAFFAKPSPYAKRPLPDGPVLVRHISASVVRLEKARRGFAKLVVEKGPCPTPMVLYARVAGPLLVDAEGWF